MAIQKPMTEKYSDEKMKENTGKTWKEWISFLNKAGARNMTHREITKLFEEKGYIKDGWWIQGVTVAYEQAIGKRVVGQNCYGEFTSGTSKSLDGTLDTVLNTWISLVKGKKTFNKVSLVGTPRISKTEKWRYWRADLKDNSKLSIIISHKSDGRVLFAIDHIGLENKESAEGWREYWKTLAAKMST